MRAVVVLGAALLCVASASSLFPGLTAIKKSSAPSGCCLPSKEFQFTGITVTASWDVHGSVAGYRPHSIQVDTTHNLLYLEETRLDPTPRVTSFQTWITPGALQGTWFQFIRIPGQPDCYVRNFTEQPPVFNVPCWQAPASVYEGDATIGISPVQIWMTEGERMNSTMLLDGNKCMPVAEIQIGFDESTDWIETLTNFVNPKLSIDDPAKFIPPTGCHPLPPSTPELVRQADRLLRKASML